MTLGSIAALHVAWGAGARWPARDSATLAAAFDMTEMPGVGPCLAVGAGLTGLAALTWAQVEPDSLPLSPRLTKMGVRAGAAVLALRGAGGLLRDLTGGGSEHFRQLDMLVYAPICLALAAGLWTATGSQPGSHDHTEFDVG